MMSMTSNSDLIGLQPILERALNDSKSDALFHCRCISTLEVEFNWPNDFWDNDEQRARIAFMNTVCEKGENALKIEMNRRSAKQKRTGVYCNKKFSFSEIRKFRRSFESKQGLHEEYLQDSLAPPQYACKCDDNMHSVHS
jgi:hypothetical protein